MRRLFAGFVTGIVIGIVTCIAVACVFLAVIGHVLAVEDPLVRADAIVALSGDTGARTATAVDLWKSRYAPVIIFAGASVDPDSAASGELMKREAIAAGVPASAIIVEPSSNTTQENAREVASLMKARGLRTAILVTSPYHQRRTAYLFGREFPPASRTFTNYPARDAQWDPTIWWLHEPARTLTVVELAKLAVEVASPLFH